MKKDRSAPATFNGPTNTTQTGVTLGKGRGAPRIHKKTREAIMILAQSGKTQRQVADELGMNESSLGRALKKPHIAKELAHQKAIFAMELEGIEGMAKKEATLVGLDLMRNAASEAVRARMVELFTGGKGGGVTVNVQNNVNSGGYEYTKPGERVVEIVSDAEEIPAKEGENDPD